MESGEDAVPVVHQDVSAQGDTYVAGRDVHYHSSRVQNIYFPARSDIEKIADELAAVVLAEAQTARSRLVGPGEPGDAAANVRYVKSAGRFRGVGGEATSGLSGVLRYYQSLSPQRLVVLGGPGAGKTVLALELQVLLLEARRDAPGAGLRSPVPVMFSASAYSTDTPWEDWLAGQLALRYGIRKHTAARLVGERQVLPLVDGLDEMDPADAEPKRAQALVRELNEMVRGRDRAPVVVTSRPGKYEALNRQIDRATHVEMTGLTASEAVTYLRGQFLDPDEQDRWQPVLTDLEAHPDGPLAGQLATPWRLTLALAAFRDGGDPGTLFPPPGVSGDDYSRHVGRLLLGDYLPAALRRYGTGTTYSEDQVRCWLKALADGLAWQAAHWRSGTDIVLHEWWHPTGEWVSNIAYMGIFMLPGIALIFIAPSGEDLLRAAIVVGFLSILMSFYGLISGKTPRRLKIRKIATKNGFITLVSGIFSGLFLWGFAMLMTVLTGGLAVGLGGGLSFCLFAGLMGGLIGGFAARRGDDDSAEMSKPRETIGNDGIAGLVSVFAFAFVWAPLLADTAASVSAFVLTSMFVFVFVFAVAVGSLFGGGAWMRYHFAVIIGCVRGRGPLRFGKFLDWGVEAGLLRISGVAYQFRHRQLQDWLTSPDSQGTRDAAA